MGAGLGYLTVIPTGNLTEKAVYLRFRASNNKAEYEAVIYGLHGLKKDVCVQSASVHKLQANGKSIWRSILGKE